MTVPAFSVQEIPFSYHGSWFGISPVVAPHEYADDLHLVSHQTGMHPILRFVPTVGDTRVRTTVRATPSRLTWTHDAGRIDLAYERVDTVRLRGRGLGLRLFAAAPRLTPFSGTYLYRDPVDGSHVFTSYETGRRYRVTVAAGPVADTVGVQRLGSGERGLHLPGDGEPWEIAIEEFDSARPPYAVSATFEEVAASAEAEFSAFVDAVAPWRTADTPAAELAAYVLWSATVRPAGFVRRPAVLMSKHWMDKVWSWDHCFNALALAEGAPELAWDQFQVPFDHQDETGGLPDSVTHSEVLYNFVKPPIHGWALRRLRERLPHDLDRAALTSVYERLEAWTNFWLTARRSPGESLPHYHHGNDSGWDNATTFDPGHVIQTSDLAAFLVLQLRELSGLADELGRDGDAIAWRRTADRMCTAMLEELWAGDRFRTREAGSGRTWTSSSLLDLMAIVLGPTLDTDRRETLARRVEEHLTPYGLASELTSSAEYRSDGYWRGPIWAPSTVLVEDGLRRGGFTGLADEVSARFRALCEKSGFAENFDARTGAPLRDRAYTWTASGYLILAGAYERRRAAR
jgi:glycogen debranching enzyme